MFNRSFENSLNFLDLGRLEKVMKSYERLIDMEEHIVKFLKINSHQSVFIVVVKIPFSKKQNFALPKIFAADADET